LSKSLAKNTIYKLILNIFNTGLPFILGMYITRALGKEQYGNFTYIQGIYQYFLTFATFGVYQYGLREISKVRDDKDRLSKAFSNIFIITLLSNLLVGGVYILSMHLIFGKVSILHNIAIVMSINFFANIFYVEWAAEALERFDFITIKTIIVQTISCMATIILVKSAKDVVMYVLILGVTLFLNYFVSFIFIKGKIDFNFKRLNLKKHIKPMFLVVILTNASILYTNLDKIILGAKVGKVYVGYYFMCVGIIYAINNLLLTFVQVTIPRLSYYLSKGEKEVYNSLLNKMSKIYLMILFPAAIGVSVIGRECVLLYGGKDYIDAIPLMPFFAVYMIIVGYENIVSNQIMYLNGKEKEQVICVFIGGIVNLVLNFLCVFLGIFSAKVAITTTIIANFVLVICEYIYVRKNLNININLFGLDKVKYFLISLVFIPITIFLRRYLDGMILLLISIILVNSIVYLLILLITKDKIIFELIKNIKEKVKR